MIAMAVGCLLDARSHAAQGRPCSRSPGSCPHPALHAVTGGARGSHGRARSSSPSYGESEDWPPDRPPSWITVIAVAYPLFSEWRFGDSRWKQRGRHCRTGPRHGRTALRAFATAPLFGIGFGRFQEDASVGIAAHNWFVQGTGRARRLSGLSLWGLFTAAVVLALSRRPRPAQTVGYSVLVVWIVAEPDAVAAHRVRGQRPGTQSIVAAAVVGDWVPRPRASRTVTVGAPAEPTSAPVPSVEGSRSSVDVDRTPERWDPTQHPAELLPALRPRGARLVLRPPSELG